MQIPVVTDIWISADHWGTGQWTPDDDIVDVFVELSDQTRWVATVCAYRHVETLRERWRQSGECLGGSYFWAANLILAADTTRASIEALVSDLLLNGEFEHALAPVAREKQGVAR
jgi:hypothetical protein